MASNKKLQVVHVAVVGLTSSSFPGMLGQGAGKSFLCNRFVRPKRDDLCLNHSSIMTNSDFGSSVVNNDHYLYWGEKIAALEDGSVSFQIVEHTEFVEDGNLQLYSIVKPYHKRCIQSKLMSGGKIQYVHPDQLAVPDEFSDVSRFPDKFTVDGYIICIDVSDNDLPDPHSVQREFLGRLLPAIMGVKKAHVVVAMTKFDAAKERSVSIANELVSKLKRQVPVIEVSSLEGVNVDVCFLVLAHLVDSRRPRTRVLPFATANNHMRERVRKNEESFQNVLSQRIQDFSLPLREARRLVENEVEFFMLRELKGSERVNRLIIAQLKYLKEARIKSKMADFLLHIRAALQIFVVTISLEDTTESCLRLIRGHKKFSGYFAENEDWREDEELLRQEHTTQVPFSVLSEPDGRKILQERIDTLHVVLREEAACEKISTVLHTAQNLIPGSTLEEVLSDLGLSDQLSLITDMTKAHHIFQERMAMVEQECVSDIIELLLEHPKLFTLSEEVALATVHEQLKDDIRYQRLEKVEQRRTSTIIKHIGVMKWPDKGPFALSPILDNQSLFHYGASSQHQLATLRGLTAEDNTDSTHNHTSSWTLTPNSTSFTLAVLGRTSENALTLRSDFMNHMSGSGECEVRGVKYQIELTVHHGTITTLLPSPSSSSPSSSSPQGAVVVVNSEECLIWLEEVLQSLWIPLGDSSAPYWGLPLVILALDHLITDGDTSPTTPLCKRAKELANAVQCVLMTERPTIQPKRLVLTSVISPLLSSLLDSVSSYSEFLSNSLSYNPKALNVAVFSLAEDPYSSQEFLSPWLHHQAVCSDEATLFINCPLERQHSIVHLSFFSSLNIPEIQSKVFAGIMCVYSPQRPASLSILGHLLSQVPKIPVMIVAMVTDGSCDDHVTEEGRRLAKQYGAYFMSNNSKEWGIGCTTEFFSQCWFSRFSSWSVQNFNPKGNRDRPLPQPLSHNHSSMHDLTAREEISSSLPTPTGPAPPPPPSSSSSSDVTRSMSPSRPHSVVGLLKPDPLSSPPPPPPPLTSPPPFTGSLPRPPKNKPPRPTPTEQIYSDPVEMVMDSQQKKATLQRRQERGHTLPRTPGGGTPLSPEQSFFFSQHSSSTALEDPSYADPKDIIKIAPNPGTDGGPFTTQAPDMSPPPPPPVTPPITNGSGGGGQAEDLYDVVQQPAATTKKSPPLQPARKGYDHLSRQISNSKKYDHLAPDEPAAADGGPPNFMENCELDRWYPASQRSSERPPAPMPPEVTNSVVPQPQLEHKLPEYATVGTERRGTRINQTPLPQGTGKPPAAPPPPSELYSVVNKPRNNLKPLTTVPVTGGNGRHTNKNEEKNPQIPTPSAIVRGSNTTTTTAAAPTQPVYATVDKKRTRTPPGVLPKPSPSNGRRSPTADQSRRIHHHGNKRKVTQPRQVGGAISGGQWNGTNLTSYGVRARSTEQLSVAPERSPQHYVPDTSDSGDLYALPTPRKNKRPPVAPKPLTRRSPSPVPPLPSGGEKVSFVKSLPPRGKSFDLDDRTPGGGVSPTHRTGSPQPQRRKVAGGVALPVFDRSILDPRLRTTSDPFAQSPRHQPPQGKFVPVSYGKRAASNEELWDGGGGWNGRERPNEIPVVPRKHFSPVDMGLEEEPPPLPPRNYDWSDVEDDDEDLFQSEDELEEPANRISLEEQHAMYSSLRLYQKKTNSMAGIEELYAIVNQVAKEQEERQVSISSSSSPNHHPPQVENVEASNVYDTLESALLQKEQLRVKKEITAAMTQSSSSSSSDEKSRSGAQTPTTQSALGTISGHGKAVFTPKQLKLIKQQQKLLDKLQKKTEREADRRRKSETRRKKREEKKGKKSKNSKEPEQQRYFGSPLEKVVEEDGVPRFIKQCTRFIESKGLRTEGIYRVSGKKDVCLDLQDKYDINCQLDVESLDLCETAISSTLKAFFKLLPDPLIPNPVATAVLNINVEDQSDHRQDLERILHDKMPSPNLSTLRYLMLHLHEVQLHRDVNKMSSSNLAIVFWPTLMRPPLTDLADPSKQLCWQLTMARLIEHPDIVPQMC